MTVRRSLVISLSLSCWAACAETPPSTAQVPVVSVPSAPASAAPPPPPAPPSPPPPAAPGALRTDPFGGDRWGFVEASSSDGRLVVLRRFAGTDRPSFGHHGDSSSSTELTVFDRMAGTERAIDDIIDVEPSRRFLLVLAQGQVLLVDARTAAFEPLAKADMDGDGNRCLSPRQATFSAAGRRVGWPTADGFRVRDLRVGEEWVVKAKERLWRGWPDDDHRGVTLAEVPSGTTGWPRQRTSCACRWCNRFAMSYGVYGWDGPSFTLEHVADDGTRAKADPPEGERRWRGKTDQGCTLEPKSEEHGLEHGPWRWACPGHP